MALRYGGRKLSFDVLSGDYGSSSSDETLLSRSVSDSFRQNTGADATTGSNKQSRRKRKTKTSKKKKKVIEESLLEEPITEKRVDAVFDDHSDTIASTANDDNNRSISYMNGSCELDYQSYNIQTVICEEIRVPEKENEIVRTVHQVSEKDYEILNGERRRPFVEVRRRSRPPSGTIDESIVMNISKEMSIAKEASIAELSSGGQLRSEVNGNFGNKLEKTESLDWNHLMAKDSDFSSMEKSPVTYFMGEIHRGYSLRGTTIIGNEKERERVYDTIFRLPWRCELIIDVGFFVCLDSFLSLLTIMPARILTTLWRCITTRQFRRPSAEEFSDFSCLIVLACGIALLQQADISLIYHMIRGQGTIKLYVVYNVLEIFDRLCQNFCGDVLQTLFGSAKGLASSPPENVNFWLLRFISDQALTIVASIAHSFVLLAQAITLSTCIVSHNNALLALLVSNNFAEIKSNVFKRFSKDNIHSLVYFVNNQTMEKYFKRKSSMEPLPTPIERNEDIEPRSSIRRIEASTDDIQADPGLRTPILNYHPNVRDQIRRAYLLKGPCQPRNHAFPSTMKGDQMRHFREEWFDEYPTWLEYSISDDAIFCLYCYLFKSDKGNQKGGKTFVSKGFSNWRKEERIEVHVGNHNSPHNQARKSCDALMNQNQHIESVLVKQSNKTKAECRTRLTAVVVAIRYLLRQGLPFRDNDESEESSNRGNFLEFLKVICELNEDIKVVSLSNAPLNNKLTSSYIQKDIINIIATEVINSIIEDIGDSFFLLYWLMNLVMYQSKNK